MLQRASSPVSRSQSDVQLWPGGRSALQTGRSEFWRSVGGSTVLPTDGVLRAENLRLALRYDVTQDDALWEVRWARRAAGATAENAGGGYALRLRPDLDLSGLEQAVTDAVPGVEEAQLVPDQQLTDVGPGDLLDPKAWRMSFTGRTAEVVVVYPEGTSSEAAGADASTRLTLAEEWPTTESVGWGDAFGLPPGLTRNGYAVTETGGQVVASADDGVLNPSAAATVALAGLVPWGVCSEIDWLAEPTGR